MEHHFSSCQIFGGHHFGNDKHSVVSVKQHYSQFLTGQGGIMDSQPLINGSQLLNEEEQFDATMREQEDESTQGEHDHMHIEEITKDICHPLSKEEAPLW